MAPRKKNGTSRGSLNSLSNKENVYLRSLSDYQTRVRRRESVRNSKNVAEYDLERKIELEIKMREGSSRLLAAARHPAQSLEAARALLTSNERMSTYMAELHHRKKHTLVRPSSSGSRGRLSVSDLRFPLMWRDSDHFKNRGDHRRFAVFCLARVGTNILDTSLLCPIDREQTDISFPDILIFNNVPPEFELILEIYSHVLQEDLSIASTPKRIGKTIHSSISKTVGRKLAMSLRDEFNSDKIGPQFDLMARARMTLDDTDPDVRTHDLTMTNFGNKSHALPLFEHFCCRLAARPDCVDEETLMEISSVNDRYRWAQLQGFHIDVWESKQLADQRQNPAYTIPLDKETLVRRTKSMSNCLRIINRSEDIENHNTIIFDTVEQTHNWHERLKALIKEHSRWKHAGTVLQSISHIETVNSSTKNFLLLDNKRQGSLYDETPLTETLPSFDNASIKTTNREGFLPDGGVTRLAGYRDLGADTSTTRRSRFSAIPIVPLKSHWIFSDKNHHR